MSRLCPPNFLGPYFHVFAMPPNFRGIVSSISYAPEFVTVIYFIHQMAIHNATKLLPLTNQTKLTLTVTLTITDTLIVLRFTVTHISLTPIKGCTALIKGIFHGGA